jgi:XTP/dITP diphosphohydrolase
MKVVLASHNVKKAQELQALLASSCPDITILTLCDIGFTEEIVEDGVTFLDNAMLKAMAVTRLGHIAIADDSGLIVDALQGAPGVYSARYAGEHASDDENRQKLLKELENVPLEQRTAHFYTSIVCTFPDGRDPILCNGRCDGIILESEVGDGGFGYDSLFYYPDYEKTFAQMTASEKASVSHRGRAMRALAVALSML